MTVTKLLHPLSYCEYIGIMTAKRFYREIKVLVVGEIEETKYFKLLKKMPGISFGYVGELEKFPVPEGEEVYLFDAKSLTIGDDRKKKKEPEPEVELDVVIMAGEFLFDHKDTDSIPSKYFTYTPISNIEKANKITPEFVGKSNTIYAEFVQMLLSERVWNPFNDSIWGVALEQPLSVRPMYRKFRFHVLGLVHLPTSREYMSCAFTQKNWKLCKMLMDLGHEVFLYGAEGSDAPCTEFIETHTLKDIRTTWGEGDNRFEIGYNWKKKQFKHDFDQPPMQATTKAMNAMVSGIVQRKRPDDFLLITQGVYQESVAKAVNLDLTVEPGIGYRGSFARFRVFESTYIQNYTYGGESGRASINGNYYDRVIPNYFDENDFQFQAKKSDYYLFMGRLIPRKGIETAVKTVKAIGGKLIVAGQISSETDHNLLKDPCVEYIGYADVKKRAELMSRAKAVFTPSIYLEPFCGVHAEAMLCGTPVLTTNFGAFTDYVIDGVNGYKCNTLQDFVDAARLVDQLDPFIIKNYAKKFTLNSVGLEYQRWFQDLFHLKESMDDPSKKGWNRLY